MTRTLSIPALLAAGIALGACSASYTADSRVLGLVSRAEFGRAREALFTQTPPADKLTDLLDATKKGMMALADGLPDAAESDFEVVFDTLRTQGLNADRTTESIFVNEQGTRIWKGEPFEQAMAYMAIAEGDASRGDWGNARASAENALFHLRDYGDTADRAGQQPVAYTSVESTFALGYMLHGIAALEMQRREEAEESFSKATATRPALGELVRTLLEGRYDTILVIDYGLGPRREAVGDGGVGVAYFPRTRSDDSPVRIEAGDASWDYPQACDVNEMSRDSRWQSLESIRRFKQGLGQVMMLGGVVLASTGGTHGDDDVARLSAGLGLLALGAISQANARADTRHNELLPQRVYIAAVDLAGWSGPVRVSVEGHAGGRMTLHGLGARAPGEHVFRYVRLPIESVDWSEAPELLYGNDATGPLDPPALPWVLGGNDARYPTPQVAADYERAGLRVGGIGDTLGELKELYRQEGIKLFPMDDERMVTGHIFEGGHSLYTPLPGTTGFTRLFARPHGAYRPVGEQARALLADLNDNTGGLDPRETTR